MTYFIDFLVQYAPYATVASVIASCSLGAGIGQGLIGTTAIKAVDQQPSSSDIIMKTALLGMALIETSALIGVLVAGMLIHQHLHPIMTLSTTQSLGTISIAIALCLPGLVIGIVSSLPAQAACMSIARQPFFNQYIARFMLITQSLIQTPILFALIVALFIHQNAMSMLYYEEALRSMAAALCIGLGTIGPAIGLAKFAQEGCRSLGINPSVYYKMFYMTLVGESIIETPAILAFIFSLFLLLGLSPVTIDTIGNGIACVAGALALGIGTFAPGISLGVTAAAAAHQIAYKPELYNVLFRTSMIALAIIESCVIYAAIIASILVALPTL